MMCIFVLVDGSVGTGTPGCAFGGGPGGHGSGGVFGGYTTGGVSANVPSGPAGSTSMSTNSVGDCAMVATATGLATVGNGCSPHEAIKTAAADKARSEAITLGEDISTPGDSRFDTSSHRQVRQDVNHELKRPNSEDFRVKPQSTFASAETAREFWER